MRVRLIHKSDPHTGKGRFASRLAAAMHELGATVVTENGSHVNCDLQFGKWAYEPKHCDSKVLRLGPAHVDKNQKYKALNQPKWYAAKRCDGVIYQSEYSKRICHTFLGNPPGREAVIYNGAPIIIRNCHREYWLAAARKWLPQKRLSDLIYGYIAANTDRPLLVAGDVSYAGNLPNAPTVRYMGLLNNDELSELYSRALGLLHVVYLDACPNVVVEAITHGCPIIYTDQGGTEEIARLSHHGCRIEDKPYRFKPIDLNRPPSIDPSAIARAIETVESDIDVDPYFGYETEGSLNIRNVAEQYLTFFNLLEATDA